MILTAIAALIAKWLFLLRKNATLVSAPLLFMTGLYQSPCDQRMRILEPICWRSAESITVALFGEDAGAIENWNCSPALNPM